MGIRTTVTLEDDSPRPPTLTIEPFHVGYNPTLNHDSVEAMLEHGEGELHR